MMVGSYLVGVVILIAELVFMGAASGYEAWVVLLCGVLLLIAGFLAGVGLFLGIGDSGGSECWW